MAAARAHRGPARRRSEPSLRSALGEAAGEGDRFLAFLGTLSLLADAAEDAPVLVVVDDAHWLDDASAAALLFVARRLQAERVALLFAARDGDAAPLRRPRPARRSSLGGRPDGAADAAALASRDPASRSTRRCATGWSPRPAATRWRSVELAGALTADQLAGQAPLPAQLPLTGGVERAFLDRYRRLAEAAQRFLLVAAADDTARLPGRARRRGPARADDDALDAVERPGCCAVDGDQLSLFHPLVRSAVYGAATSAQRRAAHRALADALPGDPDRRAWHLAAAADRPDEQTVAALDEVAERAAGRGGHEAAAARGPARPSSPRTPPRGRPAAAAAGAAWLAAQPSGPGLADAAAADATDPLLRADLDRLPGPDRVEHRFACRWLTGSCWPPRDEVAGIDAERARGDDSAGDRGGHPSSRHGAEDMSARMAALGDAAAAPDGDPRRCARCWPGSSMSGPAVRPGGPAAAPRLRRRRTRVGTGTSRPTSASPRLHLGDDRVVLDLHARQLAEARENGALVMIVHALTRRSFGEIVAGDWTTAAAGAAEALDLAASSGQPALTALPHAWLALLAALREPARTARRASGGPDRLPSRRTDRPVVADLGRWARRWPPTPRPARCTTCSRSPPS